MAVCQSCKKEREKEGKAPRKLTRLPVEITQNSNFKRKGLPVQVCEYCDGDSLLMNALRTHEKRSPNG